MGPRSIERGECSFRGIHVISRPLLQWGRAQLSAESNQLVELGDVVSFASMGPRSIERGESADWQCRDFTDCVASMGPRSIERGEDGGAGVFAVFVGASMGPRSIERGESAKPHPPKLHQNRFNGAALN